MPWHQHVMTVEQARHLHAITNGGAVLDPAVADDEIAVICEWIGDPTAAHAPGDIAWISTATVSCDELPDAVQTTEQRLSPTVPATCWVLDDPDVTVTDDVAAENVTDSPITSEMEDTPWAP